MEGQKAIIKCPIFLVGKVTVLTFGNETTKYNVAFSLRNASAVTMSWGVVGKFDFKENPKSDLDLDLGFVKS